MYINEIEDEIKNIHDYLWRQKKELENLDKDLHERLNTLGLLVTLLNSEDFKVVARQKNLLNSVSLFDYKCIMINRKDQVQLEKAIFRISRGHSWVKTIDIDTSIL